MGAVSCQPTFACSGVTWSWGSHGAPG